MLGWQRQGEMDPAVEQQRYSGKRRTPKQSSPADAVQTQEAVTAMAFKGLVPSPQDTSSLLLWAMEQHKQEPQAKLSEHEALFRP